MHANHAHGVIINRLMPVFHVLLRQSQESAYRIQRAKVVVKCYSILKHQELLPRSNAVGGIDMGIGAGTPASDISCDIFERVGVNEAEDLLQRDFIVDGDEHSSAAKRQP